MNSHERSAHTSMLWMAGTIAIASCALASGCAQDAPQCGPGRRVCDTACVVDGLVARDQVGVCAAPCLDSSECDGGFVCSPVRDGVSACLAPCDGSTYESPDSACVEGVQTPCYLTQPGDAECGACCDEATDACPLCAGDEYCAARTTGLCEAPQALGASCRYPRECASDNCGQDQDGGALGRCMVGQGESCNGDNCSRCIRVNENYTYCHRECDSLDAPCPNDYPHCVGSSADDTFWCHTTPAGLFRECDAGHTAARITSYRGTIDVCVPRTAAFVCGSASVGEPCE